MDTQELNTCSLEQIEARRVGNYWLYNTNTDGELIVRYVGRSDKCLLKRLRQHIGYGKYEFFSYQYSPTYPLVRTAFDIECREFHLFKDQLDNKIHPDAPRHLPYKCKYCELNKAITDGNVNTGVESQ